MKRVGNLACVDKVAHGPKDWGSAATSCSNAGLRLPSVTELYAAAKSGLLANDTFYWSDVLYTDFTDSGAINHATVVKRSVFGPRSAVGDDASNPNYFVCATVPHAGAL